MTDATDLTAAVLQVIGERIRIERGARSQRSIWRTSGFDQAMLSRIERGTYRALTVETLVRLSIALGCKPSVVFSDLDDIAAPHLTSEATK